MQFDLRVYTGPHTASFLALLRALLCNTGSVMLKPFPSMDCDDVDARLPVGLAGTIIFCGGIPGKSPKLVCNETPADADDRRLQPWSAMA